MSRPTVPCRPWGPIPIFIPNTSLQHTLNTAFAQATDRRVLREVPGKLDDFYADDVEVTSEDQPETIRGKARVGSLLLNFLVPLHVMAEIGSLAVSIRHTAIPEMPEKRIPRGHSIWLGRLVRPVRLTGALSGNGAGPVLCMSIIMITSALAILYVRRPRFRSEQPLCRLSRSLVTVLLGQRTVKAWLFFVRRPFRSHLTVCSTDDATSSPS